MKNRSIFFVFILLSAFLYSSQPSIPAPLAQPVAVPVLQGNFILEGTDGKSVEISKALIQKYAPGLFEKFNPQFKEGRTGTIVIDDLNGEALAYFKTMFEKMVKLQELANEEEKQYKKTMHEKWSNIVMPAGQEAVEAQEKAKIVAQVKDWAGKKAGQQILALQKIIEGLPNIGDYLLPLFNHASLWGIFYLEQPLGRIAAEQLDFTDPEIFKNLTQAGLSIRSQLVYLQHVDLTPKNCAKALEWLVQIMHDPAAKILEINKMYLERITDKIIKFITANIAEILREQPNFRTLLLSPELSSVAQKIKERFDALDESPLFKKLITTISQEHDLFSLTDGRVGLIVHLGGGSLEISTIDGMSGRVSKIGSYKDPSVRYYSSEWQLDPLGKRYAVLHKRSGKRLIIWDLFDKKIVFNEVLKLSSIEGLQALSETQLLIRAGESIDILDLSKAGQITRLKNPTKIFAQCVVDENHILVSRKTNPGELELWDVAGKKLYSWKLPFNSKEELLFSKLRITKIDPSHFMFAYEYRTAIVPGGFNWHFYNGIQFFDLNVLDYAHATLHDFVNIRGPNLYTLSGSKLQPLTHDFLIADYHYIRHSSNAQELFLALVNIKLMKKVKEWQPTLVKHFAILDSNHIVLSIPTATEKQSEIYNCFIPQVSSLAEILDEIQKNAGIVLPPQPAVAASIKPEAKPAPQLKRKKKQEEEEEITLAEPEEEEIMQPTEQEEIQEVIKRSKKEK